MKTILEQLKKIADKSDNNKHYKIADMIEQAMLKIASDSKKTLIIGDVHGMTDELRTLIQKSGVSSGDRIIFCGDLVDKGPDSHGTVAFARSLKSSYDVILIEGNHEEKHRRQRKYESEGKPSPLKDAEKLSEISKKLSKEDVSFLDSAVPFYRLPEFNATVVHAGIQNSIKNMPSHEEYINMPSKHKKEFDLIKRLRNVDSNGRMVPLDKESEVEHSFWAEGYDGRFGTVYFGHQPFKQDEPKKFQHAVGLDLGAVYGGKLAGVVLQEGEEPKYVTVQASKAHAEWMERD